MIEDPPRLRMFAGPNGSGKSTIKSLIRPDLLGIYLNPDEIESEIRKHGLLDLSQFEIVASEAQIINFFIESALLKKANLSEDVRLLRVYDNKIIFDKVNINSYFASVIVDFIRQMLLVKGKSFTCETVMSSNDKVELLRRAQMNGYRTYLYYVATEDPSINISRVKYRVQMGGHSVPEDKIATRYYRSLDLLTSAVKCSHRAYIFDNTTQELVWLAEITNGQQLEVKSNYVPLWFKKALWGEFPGLNT